RAVAEEPAEERLLDLDRPRPRKPHAGRAPPPEPVRDVELLGRHDEARALPLPRGPDRDERGPGEDERAGDGERSADPREARPEPAERERLHERAEEDDAVPALVEANPFARRIPHGVCTLRCEARNPWYGGHCA